MKRLLLLLLLLPIAVAAQGNPTTYLKSLPGGSSCASGTDNTTTASCPGTAPTIPSAGSTYTDPDFGNTVLRITGSGSCGQASANNFLTQSAGWGSIISSDDTGILLQSQGTSSGYFYQQLTLSGSSMSLNSSCIAITGGGNFAIMSRVTGGVIYSLNGSKIIKTVEPANTFSTLHDMSTIPGFTITSGYLVYTDASDGWFCITNNIQGSGTQIGCWNSSSGNTMVLDMTNATWQSNSGTPVALDNLTAAQFGGCGVHEFTISLNGTWMNLQCPTVGSTYPGYKSNPWVFWQMGTNHVTYAIQYAGSHLEMGTDDEFNMGTGNNSAASPCASPFQNLTLTYWRVNNFGTVSAPNYIWIPSCPPPQINTDSQHQSWINNKNDSFANQYPILNSMAQISTNSNQYLEWELDMWEMDLAYQATQALNWRTAAGGKIWRIAHTFNDPTNNQCSELDITPEISVDGKYAAFWSDFGGQTGTGTCANNRRTDVFVVRLPSQQSPVAPAPAILAGSGVVLGSSVMNSSNGAQK